MRREKSEIHSTWERVRDGLASAEPCFVREQVVDATRAFFKERGFHEVETPLFVRYPGMEPYLEVFQTEWRDTRGRCYPGFLTTSPEYAMKKLLAAGVGPLFQICKSFRNREDVSSRHNPEFTILEWYRANADYLEIMRDCEELYRAIATALGTESAGNTWTYRGKTIDLGTEWERLSVREAFTRYAGVDLQRDLYQLVDVARDKGYAMAPENTWEQAYHQIFLNEIEPRLGQTTPTFLYEYPIAMAALARASANDSTVAERFELYVAGIEMANAFGELTDADEQLRRLEAERQERRLLGKTDYAIDTDFVHALARGIPPSAGIALGIDRTAMFFADVDSIREVLWFPADELFQ